MHPIIIYLLKACAYVAAFYVPFAFLLKRSTFFYLNRIYLVFGLLLSFLLPLYVGSSAIQTWVPMPVSFFEPIIEKTEIVVPLTRATDSQIDLTTVLLLIYGIGVAVRLLMFVYSVAGLLSIMRNAESFTIQAITVFRAKIKAPFTFFKYVFLPQTPVQPGIIEHEIAHVRQFHWFDLLVSELSGIVLWFNPILTAYKRALKEQHEYLADQSAIESGVDLARYLNSIKQQIETSLMPSITSAFYFQSIKNRINMITKRKTSLLGLGGYTFVLPIILGLLMAFSPKPLIQKESARMDENNQEKISLSLPLDKSRMTLGAGYGNRMHPLLNVERLHTGIDFMAPEGVSVFSAQEGEVTKAQLDGPWGNIIVIQHHDGYSTSYSHLKSMDVKVGETVGKGQQIGLVGNTGLSSRFHLHFELHENGVALDPVPFLPLEN